MIRLKYRYLIIASICFILFVNCWIQSYSLIKTEQLYIGSSDSLNIPFAHYIENNNLAQKKFLKAYEKYIVSLDNKTIKLKSGKTFIWDDGKNKSFNEKLENADLEDMLFQSYIPGKSWISPPQFEYSPGRIRNEEFFKEIYGNSELEVRKNCISINWFGKKIPFNRVNGGADSLKAVIKDLSLLPKGLWKYFTTTSGSLCWRVIAGTKKLSMHSFGLAIDINTKYSDYWRNSSDKTYKNRIPFEIVEAFERHGFIWGGKWYHYDTMHFEYRPELLQ